MRLYARGIVVLAVVIGFLGVDDGLQIGSRAVGGGAGPAPVSVAPDSAVYHSIVSKAERLAPPLGSLLISRDGDLVVEEYFNGMQPHRLVNIKSASKSILSALMGIALHRGVIDSIDRRLVEFFPQHLDTTTAPRKAQISLRHILSMQACLETTSFYNYGEWVASSNWLRSALEQPMVCEPGSSMVYSTGNSHIVSAILTEASGMTTRQFAERYLFGPLGITRLAWDRSPEGYYFGGNNMALSPRALLKFGEMYLNGGRYDGKQILSEEWIERSWERYGRSDYSNHEYGLFWWIDEYAGRTVYFAWGYGGQYVFVVPTLDLVVVYTSSLPTRSESDRHNEELLDLLEESIIPAAER